MRSIPTTLIPLACAVLLFSPVTWSSERICELRNTVRDQVDSARCLACHDGSLAPAVHANIPAQSFENLSEAAPSSDASHPVEIDYEAARARRPAALTPASDLSPALVLTRGKLTCGTCHDGRSTLPAHVAVTLAGSRICTSCHAFL